MKYLVLALMVLLAGCAARINLPGPNDLEISIPAVTVETRPEYQNRTHLRRHWVERGTRYCEYSNGAVYQRHYRYDCPYTY
jgi:hypothetical protein